MYGHPIRHGTSNNVPSPVTYVSAIIGIANEPTQANRVAAVMTIRLMTVFIFGFLLGLANSGISRIICLLINSVIKSILLVQLRFQPIKNPGD